MSFSINHCRASRVCPFDNPPGTTTGGYLSKYVGSHSVCDLQCLESAEAVSVAQGPLPPQQQHSLWEALFNTLLVTPASALCLLGYLSK